MSVHVHVVTPVIATGLTSAADFDGILDAGDRVTFDELDTGPASVESAFHAALAAPEAVARAIEAERAGADAIVIDCMAEPGLEAARECLTIPVVGPFELAIATAGVLGRRFAVLSVTESMEPLFQGKVRQCGALDRLAAIRSIGIPVGELMKDRTALRQALLKVAMHAIAGDGADTIVLGCTGIIGMAGDLRADLEEEGLEAPVIDPIPLALKTAKSWAELGIAHSKKAFPRPPARQIAGYAHHAFDRFGA